MTKNRKPGWEYIYSESLEQTVAYHFESGWLFCSDGTKYSPHELSLLQNTQLPKCVHDVKKAFEGTIVETEKKYPKPPENVPPAVQTVIDTNNKQGNLFIW